MSLLQRLSELGSQFAKNGMWRAMRHRNFALFMTFGWFSNIGARVQRFGLQWLTWDLTHSFGWLGAVTVAEASTILVVMPLAGSLADRVDRLKLARIAQGAQMTMAAILASLTLLDVMSIPLLMVLIALSGAADGLWIPTRLAIVPDLVPREDLPAAIGINSVAFNLSQFIGPAVAGLLIALFGVGATFAANALSFIGAFIVLFIITLLPGTGKVRKTKDGLYSGFFKAAGFAFRNPFLGPMFFLGAAVSIFVRPYRELLPGFADGVFGQGVEGLALMASTAGLTSAVVSIVFASFARTKGLAKIMLGAKFVVGILFLGLALAPTFGVAVAIAAAMSGFMTIMGISSQILVQNSTPDHIRGRVMSLWAMQMRGLIPLGGLGLGLMAGVIGFQTTLGWAGVAFLICWALAARHWRALEVLEAPDAAQRVEAQAEAGKASTSA